MQFKVAWAIAILLLSIGSANAATDKYNITPAEHFACDLDVRNLCSDSMDEDDVIACMKTKHASLSASCQTTFDAGLRKRHMPL